MCVCVCDQLQPVLSVCPLKHLNKVISVRDPVCSSFVNPFVLSRCPGFSIWTQWNRLSLSSSTSLNLSFNLFSIHSFFQLSFSPSFPQLGSLESDSAESDGDTRESLIKSHFAQRIAELTNRLQHADSTAVHYNAEVAAISPINTCACVVCVRACVRVQVGGWACVHACGWVGGCVCMCACVRACVRTCVRETAGWCFAGKVRQWGMRHVACAVSDVPSEMQFVCCFSAAVSRTAQTTGHRGETEGESAERTGGGQQCCGAAQGEARECITHDTKQHTHAHTHTHTHVYTVQTHNTRKLLSLSLSLSLSHTHTHTPAHKPPAFEMFRFVMAGRAADDDAQLRRAAEHDE